VTVWARKTNEYILAILDNRALCFFNVCLAEIAFDAITAASGVFFWEPNKFVTVELRPAVALAVVGGGLLDAEVFGDRAAIKKLVLAASSFSKHRK
jgi:hypothetical protein